MIDFQNFAFEISKAINQKQFEANLQLETNIQDEAKLTPIQKLEEINKSASQIITSKNSNAVQEFINYFNTTQENQGKKEEISEKQKNIVFDEKQNINEVKSMQLKTQVKQKSYQKSPSHSHNKQTKLQNIEKNNIGILQQQPEHKIQENHSLSQEELLNRNGNANEVSKFQIYKNQLKTYQELQKNDNLIDQNSNQLQNSQNYQNGRYHYQSYGNSNEIQKSRNIVQELEQMRQKQKEKERLTVKKSELKKSKIGRIFKMNPQIEKKNQELRKNQAQQKMKANIEFLDSIKSQGRKQASPSYKEFNNFDSKDMKNLGNSLRMQNKKRLQKLGFSDRSRMKISSTYLQPFQSSPSWSFLPPIQKNSTLRPKPYSIYHINQKSNEIFYNKLQNST